MLLRLWLSVALALSMMAEVKAAVASSPRPDLVAKVAAGEIFEARAVWWGFDEDDSTFFLQSAISSGVRRLIVDNVGKPWIVRPLFGVSNQEVVFEKGVEILAKEGDFKGRKDCLLTLDCVTNVTLKGYGAVFRMRQADYRKPPYGGEYRHTLKVRTSENITIEGLRFTESGGDGIYLGELIRKNPNRNVVIRDVTCDRNHRQGISVITADGLLIEDCVFRDTKGAPPESGIDFEPNYPCQSLKGIVVRRCLSENNKGRGFEFALGQSEGDSPLIDAVFEDCRVVGCRDSFALSMRFNAVHKESVPLPKGGRLELRRCRFERPQRSGLVVLRKPLETIDMTIEDCVIADAPETNGNTAVKLVNHMYDNAPIDGIVFSNLVVKRSSPRSFDWVDLGAIDWTGIGLKRFDGTVTIIDPLGSRQVLLDDAWRRIACPCTDDPVLPRVAFDPETASVKDEKPNESVALSPVRIRGKGRCVFYAKADGHADIRLEQSICNKRLRVSEKPLIVKDMNGVEVARFSFDAEKEAIVSFRPSCDGFYVLEFDAGRQTVVFLSSNVPIALEMAKRPQAMYRGEGFFYFAPRKNCRFSFFVGGERLEKVSAKVFSPSGEKVFDERNIGGWCRLQPKAKDVVAGLWRVEVLQPSEGACFEDYFLDLSGIPSHMFFSPKKYWLPR